MTLKQKLWKEDKQRLVPYRFLQPSKIPQHKYLINIELKQLLKVL
jgi:hypothetical protein